MGVYVIYVSYVSYVVSICTISLERMSLIRALKLAIADCPYQVVRLYFLLFFLLETMAHAVIGRMTPIGVIRLLIEDVVTFLSSLLNRVVATGSLPYSCAFGVVLAFWCFWFCVVLRIVFRLFGVTFPFYPAYFTVFCFVFSHVFRRVLSSPPPIFIDVPRINAEERLLPDAVEVASLGRVVEDAVVSFDTNWRLVSGDDELTSAEMLAQVDEPVTLSQFVSRSARLVSPLRFLDDPVVEAELVDPLTLSNTTVVVVDSQFCVVPMAQISV